MKLSLDELESNLERYLQEGDSDCVYVWASNEGRWLIERVRKLEALREAVDHYLDYATYPFNQIAWDECRIERVKKLKEALAELEKE